MKRGVRCVALINGVSMALPSPARSAEPHLVTEAEIADRVRADFAERAGDEQRVERFLTRHLPVMAMAWPG